MPFHTDPMGILAVALVTAGMILSLTFILILMVRTQRRKNYYRQINYWRRLRYELERKEQNRL